MTALGEGAKTTTSFRLPAELHRELKLLAVLRDESLAALMQESFEAFVEKYRGGADAAWLKRKADVDEERKSKLAQGVMWEPEARVGRHGEGVKTLNVVLPLDHLAALKDMARDVRVSANDLMVEACEALIESEAAHLEMLQAVAGVIARKNPELAQQILPAPPPLMTPADATDSQDARDRSPAT